MQTVSLRKIILNDYAAFLLTIGGPIALAITAFTAAFGFLPSLRYRGGQEVDAQFSLGMCAVAVILTILLFYFLLRRISRIKRLLATGPRVQATVLSIDFFKDRGRIEFEYAHQGETHTTGTAIMKNKETTTLAPGDKIDVALDPDNPRQALVVQLYCI